jgi:type II secretory pathway pseudopilin PulG
MTLFEQVKKNWQALAVIGAIIGASVGTWNYAMAQAAEVAQKEVQATVNKEMIDGAKKAAADAVKEQLPIIAREVAKEVVKEMQNQQPPKG